MVTDLIEFQFAFFFFFFLDEVDESSMWAHCGIVATEQGTQVDFRLMTFMENGHCTEDFSICCL